MSVEKQTGLEAHLPKPRRRWLRPVLLGLVIWFCGLIMGGGLTLHVLWGELNRVARNPARLTERITYRITHRLDLNEAQQNQVRRILGKYQKEFTDLRREVRPRINSLLESARQDITDILTPEQVPEWEEYYREVRGRFLPPLPRDGKKEGE